MTARGKQSPGGTMKKKTRALKGRLTDDRLIRSPIQGWVLVHTIPRVSLWADIRRPFGSAKEFPRILIYTRIHCNLQKVLESDEVFTSLY